jgi:hypothetical protein
MKKLKNNILISLFFTFLFTPSFSQTYGNEWINHSQTYIKIKIGEEGVYRLNPTILKSLGVNIEQINPQNFQIFRNGEEIPIYVEGEQDQSFDPQDFIEFYGYQNDGKLDTELYDQPSSQSSTYYSLFSDTSLYFLTWNNQNNNLRLSTYQNYDFTGKSPDSYFIYEATQFWSNNFYSGIPNNNDPMQLFSEYTSGEGFHRYVWSTRFTTDIQTPALSTNGPAPNIEVLAYSTNHNQSMIVDNANHEFGVAVKNANNNVGTQRTLGHQKIFINRDFDRSLIDPVTRVWLGEITFQNSAMHVNYCKIKYPRNLDFANESILKIKHKFNSEYLRLNNYSPTKSAPIVYDFSTRNRIIPSKSGNEVEWNLRTTNQLSDMFIFDETDITEIVSAQCVLTTIYETTPPQSTNYLIVTNTKLDNGAKEYKKFRESMQGGGYQVDIVYVNDLYDNYTYGIEHPLALKRFFSELKIKLPNLEHILLLGKGQMYTRIRRNPALKEAFNLVPTIGHPSSDMLFVSDLSGNSLVTNFSIGRIPARDNNQIMVYLDKIKAFENTNHELWRKKVIQLAGGSTQNETNSYVNYLNNYYRIFSDTNVGGNRVLFTKQDPIGIDESMTSSIINEVNKGSSILSYFGHGAAQVTEISLGEPSQYNNVGKTPLFLFNGCALGNTFEDLSLGEQFLFEPNKGAVGWIASTNFGFTNVLYFHTLQFYKELTQNQYGKGVGTAMQNSLSNWGNPASALERMQARQLVFHGDPALRLFQAEFPEYETTTASISWNSGFIDSAALKFTVVNNGKARKLNLPISITSRNSSNQIIYTDTVLFNAPNFSSDFTVMIPKNKLGGLVRFEIKIDSKNEIEEQPPIGKTNNLYTFSEVFLNEVPKILQPTYDAIVTNRNIELIIQLTDYSIFDKQIEIQWDTTPYFTTLLGQQQLTTQQHLIKSNITLNVGNNKDYYVRVRSTQNSNTSDWTYTTFGLIENDEPGWTEGNRWKFFNTSKERMEYDTLSQSFGFKRSISRQYKIVTNGNGNGRFNERYIVIDGTPAIINWWPVGGVALMFINPDTDIRYSESSNPFNLAYPNPWWPPGELSEFTVVGNPSGVYHYNTDVLVNQDSMIAMLDRVPEGHHMIMMSLFNSDPTQWKPELWNALENYGVSRLKMVQRGEPFGIYGKKGAETPAVEYLADYNNTVTPPSRQRLEVAEFFSPKLTDGLVTSKVIGPVKKWEQLKFTFEQINSNDSFFVDVFGSTDRTQWRKIISTQQDSIIDLSSIDVSIYPYVYFELKVQNKVERTVPNIHRWKINYQPLGDVSIDFDREYAFHSDTVPQGSDVFFSLGFSNLFSNTFDSTTCLVYIRDASNKIDTISYRGISPINALDGIVISDTIKTLNRRGANDVFVIFNPQKNPKELDYENNLFFKTFHIEEDDRHPLLDVVFDGIQIMNEDIVSPNTLITISVSDDNPYMLIDELSYIKAALIHPDGKVDSLNQFPDQFWFQPSTKAGEKAVLEYQAIDLPTGIYTLLVNAQDATGNMSGTKPYTIKFKVIRESSISNIYPYPNPFSTSTRFVFTLTGDRAPDYMKIQIMNVAGKVVREITHADLGPIRIGNNLSEFIWDGTDEFGDRLANGVYFYKVTAKLDGKDMDAFEGEDGSNFFKNGIGKMYLMR